MACMPLATLGPIAGGRPRHRPWPPLRLSLRSSSHCPQAIAAGLVFAGNPRQLERFRSLACKSSNLPSFRATAGVSGQKRLYGQGPTNPAGRYSTWACRQALRCLKSPASTTPTMISPRHPTPADGFISSSTCSPCSTPASRPTPSSANCSTPARTSNSISTTLSPPPAARSPGSSSYTRSTAAQAESPGSMARADCGTARSTDRSHAATPRQRPSNSAGKSSGNCCPAATTLPGTGRWPCYTSLNSACTPSIPTTAAICTDSSTTSGWTMRPRKAASRNPMTGPRLATSSSRDAVSRIAGTTAKSSRDGMSDPPCDAHRHLESRKPTDQRTRN